MNWKMSTADPIVAPSDEVGVIAAADDSFEHESRWFWSVFDWTIGYLLARHIERKSLRIVLRAIHEHPEAFVEDNGGVSHILNEARSGFGRHHLSELFELRTKFFNFSSPLMQHFCKNVAMAAALDDVYNAVGSFSWNGQPIYPLSAPPDAWSNFYLSCPNGQAVRNRYRQVEHLYRQYGGGRTLSIACGSAQALIHALHEMKTGCDDRECQLILTDVSKESLDIAQKRAEQAGIKDQVTCKRMSLRRLTECFAGEKFEVVEACGILDYLPDEEAVKLLQSAWQCLRPEGLMIVSNMSQTRGATLLLKMYNWPIRYRSPQQLGQLIRRAGGANVKVYLEPWGIHPVATANL